MISMIWICKKLPIFAAALATCLPALYASNALAQDITFNQNNQPIINYDGDVNTVPSSIIQGDINSDGYPDFVMNLYTDPANLFEIKSTGNGNYAQTFVSIPAYCPAYPLAFGDFQRSGKNDLLVSTTSGSRCTGTYSNTFGDYLNNGSGNFQLYKQFPVTHNNADAIVTADFNGDKKLDAVVLDGNLLELYYGSGYGSFAGPYTIANLTGSAASLTSNYYNLIAGDFDGDGCTDVAWTEYEAVGQGYNSQLRVAYGNCHGDFYVTTPYNVVGEIDNIHTADLDRDGISEIVATLDASGQGVTDPQLQISYGQRARYFTTKYIHDASLSGPITVADLNGDGYQDIAYMSAAGTTSQAVKILEGDASQAFTKSSVDPVQTQATILQLFSGDYNRDGKMDLALFATGSGESSLMILTNTSQYPNGVCVPFATPGIQICQPGTTSGTTVHVLADGTNTNPTVYMELWVDGTKMVGYGSTNELRATFTLAPGTHQFDYFSADAAGDKNENEAYVTVK